MTFENVPRRNAAFSAGFRTAIPSFCGSTRAWHPPPLFVVLLTFLLLRLTSDPAPAQSVSASGASARQDAATETVVLPKSVPDPIEPVNRVIWGFNRQVMVGVIKPTAKVYRSVVVKPIRTGIGNFGRNITYPGRLVNNLLQGRWSGARHETDRFFCNTVVGVAGFFDVASRWKIPKSDADFGQTFGRWGWKPECYLMLPIFGPSNERDALGFGADTAANPLTYLKPYPFIPDQPLTYFSPYAYYSGAVVYNSLSDSVDKSVRLVQSEMDPYSLVQYAWTFARETRAPDFKLKGPQEEASLQTLQSVSFTNRNPKFPNWGKTRSVSIPSTGKKLKYTFWLQPEKAPVVYIIPGLGSHRLSETVIALAELAYEKGFSAVCISSPYNYEFMEHASTAHMPAYTPIDADDVHVALTAIDHRLQKRYPDRLGAKALMGYSMGGFQSLFVAASEATNERPLLKFDRYVAIHTPVRLLHGISQLDEFYEAPLVWPAAERTANIENTFLKVAALSTNAPAPSAPPPFDAVESRFLIGLTFRFILRDAIFSSQRRHNQGIIQQPIDEFRRAPVYREILQYSYKDYFEKFATPYYRTRGIDLAIPEVKARAGDLRTHARALQANPNIRVIVNRNDILLASEDLEWLEATFEPERLRVFDKGGHLGNLSQPEVQQAIVGALDGLRPVQRSSLD
jgi:ABC-type transporter lipoprotein component MlaA/pimeloyl-ACP methyl ester carboxylesterase